MDEVIEAIEKYQGLVPLVYDIETMGLDEARPQDMPYAVYLKREADKVIADLEESHKMEVEQLLIEIDDLKKKLAVAQQVLRLNKPEALFSDLETMGRLNHEKDVVERRERHHKHKRCLANARIALDDWHLHNSFYAMGHQEFEKRKCEFYEKWRQRWLELADKLKEAK